MNAKSIVAGACAMLSLSAAAQAQTILLTFEGLGDGAPIGDFYAHLGVTFSSNTRASVSVFAGGTSRFTNAPTMGTNMYFADSNAAIMNVAAGFTTGFSFFYTSPYYDGFCNVYDGPDGTGNILATINLAILGTDNTPGAPYDRWASVGASFSGTARSVALGGTAQYIGFDNITFGSATALIPLPPASMAGAATLLGLGSIRALRRRRLIADATPAC
jgi:hypothetical protein